MSFKNKFVVGLVTNVRRIKIEILSNICRLLLQLERWSVVSISQNIL